MYRTFPYLMLFAAAVLLQVFLFDNLAISVYFNPLIYLVFIVLLPLDMPPVALLLAGLVTGVTMDWATGAAGVNTIATLPVAVLRPGIVAFLYNREDAREGGIPSVGKFGFRIFLEYIIVLVLVHHTIFFFLEALSLSHVLHTIVRIVVSSIVSICFIWLIARIFTSNLTYRA